MKKQKELYIYIITHPKFDSGWLKIGRTVNLAERVAKYNTGCPNREYKYEYYKSTTLEKVCLIENYFRTNIPDNGFEWYRCPVQDAKMS
jgi:hypothetical protein